MRIYKGHRFRVYPTPAQEARLIAWESALRWLWNIAHEQRLMGLARTDKRYLTAFEQMRDLTVLRHELPWLDDVPYVLCAKLLIDLDKAWQFCFKRLARVPRWKRKNVDRLGLTDPYSKTSKIGRSTLRFPKIGDVRAVIHRDVAGLPRTCTLKRDGDQWFASVLCAIDVADPAPRAEPVVALDRGITHLIADSDGKLTENPRFYERAMKRLAHAQRVVSRRKKGSKNREKAKLRVTRLHRKVRRQREHVLHELSAAYAKSHGTVVVEKLNVRGLKRGRQARGIADAGWSRFAEMLRYKLAWSGGTLIEVPAHYSSQTCSACGCVDALSRKREAFNCTSCGHVDHADLNAAKILKSRANRSALPVEGLVLEAAQRSRKAKVTLRTPRRSASQGPAA